MAASGQGTAQEQWVARLSERAKRTPRGVRVDLRCYIYPDGHGNILYRDAKSGATDTFGQPVNNVAELLAVVEQLWARAMALPTDGEASE